MKRRLAIVGALLLSVAAPASAHRLDEYLQATTIAVEKNRVRAQLRLAPGVLVVPALLRAIDTDADGAVSAAEQRAYAERVLRDLSLTLDGRRVPLRLVSWRFAPVAELRAGRGEIQLALEGDVPNGGPDRTLAFENRHQPRIAAYLVNSLVPRDPDVRITGQRRNYEQSSYRLDYVQAGAAPAPPAGAPWTGVRGWLGAAALLPLAWLASARHRRARAADGEAARG